MVRRCRVCGETYETCYSCEKTNSWRALTDTADHYYMLCTLMEYQSDGDAKKAYRALRKRGIDLRETSSYLPSIQALLNEINEKAYGSNGRAKQTSFDGGMMPVVNKCVDRTSIDSSEIEE